MLNKELLDIKLALCLCDVLLIPFAFMVSEFFQSFRVYLFIDQNYPVLLHPLL